MDVFGWAVLITFALIGFAVVAYAFAEFIIVQVRMFHVKIASELEISREDNKKTKELKRERLETQRKAKHKAKTDILNARLSKLGEKTNKAIDEIEQKS